ncbi:MAG: YkvA family protein [Pseudomonadota bacterium]
MSDARSLARMAGDPDKANLPLAVEKNRRRARKVTPKLLKYAGRIPFAEDLAAAYFCALDPVTPGRVKGVLFAALGYFVMPADLLPDVIAALGFTDDATVLATALGVVGAHIKPRHKRAARRLLNLPEPPIDIDH